MRVAVKPLVIALSAFSFISVAQASDATNMLDLNFGKDTFRVHYDKKGFASADKLYTDIGWLHHSDHGDMAEFGIHAVGKTNHSDSTYAGIGAKLHYLHFKGSSINASGLGVGGLFRYSPNFHSKNETLDSLLTSVNFSGYAYYVPSAMAFSDLDNLINTGASVNFDVIQNASINLGYRYTGVKLDYTGSKREKFDSSAFVGFSLSF